mgnify:CR=1 FL=1
MPSVIGTRDSGRSLTNPNWLSQHDQPTTLHTLLLLPNGSIWATLDDNEAHYLKVFGDQIFGRECFIADSSWQKRDGPPNDGKIGSIMTTYWCGAALAPVVDED